MNAKATAFAAVAVIIVATAIMLGIRLFSGPEDSWICQNGQWVEHGNPTAPKPDAGCGNQAENKVNKETENQVNKNESVGNVENEIKVNFPASGNIVASSLEVVGEAKGTWFFEGSFPAKLLDSNGKMIGEAPATALGEWMTTDMVPFRAILSAPENFIGPATVVLSADDPSGQKAEKKIEIPITIEKNPMTKIKLFFSSLYFDPESANCEKVYPVERIIPKTKSVAKATIEELLKGITEEEKSGGYYTSINSDVKLNGISLANGTIKADFDKKMEEGVGGSCRTSAIIAQITETLKQFPTVKSVVISIDGKSEGILQP